MTDDKTHQVSIEDELADLREEKRELERKARDVDRHSDDEAEQQKAAELTVEYQNVVANIRGLQNVLDDWGGGDFTIREFTYGELMRTRDEVAEKSAAVNRNGNDQPRDGYQRLRVLELGVEDAPDGAPDDPKEYPPHVGQWLYDVIDELNTYGEVGLGNFSPWEPAPDQTEEREKQTISSNAEQ